MLILLVYLTYFENGDSKGYFCILVEGIDAACQLRKKLGGNLLQLVVVTFIGTL